MNESHPRKIPVIGILGGIGSGKSSVIRRVSSFNLLIIDADRIGHQLLHDREVQAAIRNSFGAEVFSSSATIDRKQLGARVFGDTPAHAAALSALNRILHPRIRKEIRQQIDTSAAGYDAVILDAALLLESGWAAECDALIFIDTSMAERTRRVIRDRGWSGEELKRRESTQVPIAEKRGRADFVVHNSGLPEASAEQMERILHLILSQHSSGGSL